MIQKQEISVCDFCGKEVVGNWENGWIRRFGWFELDYRPKLNQGWLKTEKNSYPKHFCSKDCLKGFVNGL